MNDWQMEKMAESRRQAIQNEFEQINLQKLVTRERPQPFLFRLGSGLVALGRRLRKRHPARARDQWAIQNEFKAQHR